MKKSFQILLIICVLTLSLGFITIKTLITTLPTYTDIPSNAQGTGTVITASRFNEWIGGASPAVDVFVKPADGTNFVGDNLNTANNLDFFRWSEQMFLWLLSPVPSDGTYGSCGGVVLNSPMFYDFTNNSYIKHNSCRSTPIDPNPTSKNKNGSNLVDVSKTMSFNVKTESKGTHNLPMFFERISNKMYDVDKTPKSEKGHQLIYSDNNIKTEVFDFKVINGKIIFLDIKGKTIKKPSLILSKGLDIETTAQQFIFNSNLITITTSNFELIIIQPNVNHAERSDVLMARNNSLVYYNIMVNDVYAVFSTMVNKGDVDGALRLPFPTSKNELDVIKNYATAHNIQIANTDNRVLAMELKTSWVETTNLSYADSYLIVKAKIPNYILTTPTTWTRSGTRSTTLALVGMHVVGSVAGHQEMIWSTFEHKNNCPSEYIYNQIPGTQPSGSVSINTSNATNWLFCSPSTTPIATNAFNISHIKQSGNNINPAINFSISPSNTKRNMAFGWGGTTGQTTLTNPANPTDVLDFATSNTLLLSLNADANNNLQTGDIRKNYFLVGATWNTLLGEAHGNVFDNHVGTKKLSNSTMETYTQSNSFLVKTNEPNSRNCFSCHISEDGNTNQNLPAYSFLSHVFYGAPLF